MTETEILLLEARAGWGKRSPGTTNACSVLRKTWEATMTLSWKLFLGMAALCSLPLMRSGMTQYPKDQRTPSVLNKTTQYFAPAVVFLIVCTVFLALLPWENSTMRKWTQPFWGTDCWRSPTSFSSAQAASLCSAGIEKVPGGVNILWDVVTVPTLCFLGVFRRLPRSVSSSLRLKPYAFPGPSSLGKQAFPRPVFSELQTHDRICTALFE